MIMANITLKEYLNEITICEDLDKLRNELDIYDNYPILFYGDQKELYSKLTQAFRESNENSIIGCWDFVKRCGLGTEIFNYRPGTVVVQVNDHSHGMWMSEKNKIKGLNHSMYIMFHPSQEKEMNNVHWLIAIALSIKGVGDYIIQEKLTARFPNAEEGINYIP